MSSDRSDITSGTNPYRPVLIEEDHESNNLRQVKASFQVYRSDLRFAISQYLIHQHAWRLVLFSLVAIGLSGWLFTALASSNRTGFPIVTGLIATMIPVAVLYHAIVFRVKRQVNVQLEEYGVQPGVACTVSAELDRLVFQIAGRNHQWPFDHMHVFRERRGLVISPEECFFLFVPKRADFHGRSYREFRDQLSMLSKSASR